MTVKIENKKLVITLPIIPESRRVAPCLIACTKPPLSGQITRLVQATIDGKPVEILLNANIQAIQVHENEDPEDE